MDDLVKSFKAYLYDRVSSPLLSSFVVSWALWNHRLLVVMISSDMKVKEKFAYADEVLYPTIKEVAGPGIAWPLLSALFLLFVYPIPGRWVFQHVRNEQKKLKAVQQLIEDETPVTQEEARNLRASLREAGRIFDQAVSERDATIKSLNAEIDTLRHDIIAYQQRAVTPASDLENEHAEGMEYSRSSLSPGENIVLRAIADNDGIAETDLKELLQITHSNPPQNTSVCLNQLANKKLIEVRARPNDFYYNLTPAGKSNLENVGE